LAGDLPMSTSSTLLPVRRGANLTYHNRSWTGSNKWRFDSAKPRPAANCRSISTSSIPSSFGNGIRYLPNDGQREPGPPLVKKNGVVGGEVGSLGIPGPPCHDDARQISLGPWGPFVRHWGVVQYFYWGSGVHYKLLHKTVLYVTNLYTWPTPPT
jgi:hypothetical protein